MTGRTNATPRNLAPRPSTFKTFWLASRRRSAATTRPTCRDFSACPERSTAKISGPAASPVPCRLLDFHPERRYSPDQFAPLAKESPDSKQREKIAAMPLPRPRKVSAAKADRLAELIAVCSITPAGERSEADFAMCCYAIRNSIAKEEVWTQVEQVGKFAEQGRCYFDRTWENAEHDTRAADVRQAAKTCRGSEGSKSRKQCGHGWQ